MQPYLPILSDIEVKLNNLLGHQLFTAFRDWPLSEYLKLHFEILCFLAKNKKLLCCVWPSKTKNSFTRKKTSYSEKRLEHTD